MPSAETCPPLTPADAPAIIADLRAVGMDVAEHIAALRQSAGFMRTGFRSAAARRKWAIEATRCDAVCDAMEAQLLGEAERNAQAEG